MYALKFTLNAFALWLVCRWWSCGDRTTTRKWKARATSSGSAPFPIPAPPGPSIWSQATRLVLRVSLTQYYVVQVKGATGQLKHTMYQKECDQVGQPEAKARMHVQPSQGCLRVSPQGFRGMYCVPSRLGYAINETTDEPGCASACALPVPIPPNLSSTDLTPG